jgi:hypothetical protein
MCLTRFENIIDKYLCAVLILQPMKEPTILRSTGGPKCGSKRFSGPNFVTKMGQ